MNEYINDLVKGDNWELNIIRAYKEGKVEINVDKFTKYLKDELVHCDCGSYIGEGYHGGATREWWDQHRVYIEQCITELEK